MQPVAPIGWLNAIAPPFGLTLMKAARGFAMPSSVASLRTCSSVSN